MAISIADFNIIYNNSRTLSVANAQSPEADMNLMLANPSIKYLGDASPATGDTEILFNLQTRAESNGNSPILAHIFVTYSIKFPVSGSSSGIITQETVHSLPTQNTGPLGHLGIDSLLDSDFQSSSQRAQINMSHSSLVDPVLNQYFSDENGIDVIPAGSSVNITCRTLWAQPSPTGDGSRIWFKKQLQSTRSLNIVIASAPIPQQSSLSITDRNNLDQALKSFSNLSLSNLLAFNGSSVLNKIQFNFKGQYIPPFATDGGDNNPAFRIIIADNASFTSPFYTTSDEPNSLSGFIPFNPVDSNGNAITNSDETIRVFNQSFTPTDSTSLSANTTYFWKLILRNDIGESEEVTDSFTTIPRRTVSSFAISDNSVIEPTFTWTYSSPSDQQFCRIRITKVDTGSLVYDKTSQQFTSSKTISDAVPSLKFDIQYSAMLFISDGKSVASSNGLEFLLTSKPVTLAARVDGKVNPTDISSSTPTFSWIFKSPTNSVQAAFQVQVGTTAGGSDLLDTGEVESSATSFTYSGPAIPTKTTIYFRIRAKSSPFSEWMSGTFILTDRPGMPTLLTPNGGEKSNTSLDITWAEASPTHPDGDPITYTLQYTQNKFDPIWIDIKTGIAEGTTSFIWDVTEIPRGDLYAVRIFSTDGLTTSLPDISDTVFSITKHAPKTPLLDTDLTGGSFRHVLEIVWLQQGDASVDGDEVFYLIELLNSAYPSEAFEFIAQVPEDLESIVDDTEAGVGSAGTPLAQLPDESLSKITLSDKISFISFTKVSAATFAAGPKKDKTFSDDPGVTSLSPSTITAADADPDDSIYTFSFSIESFDSATNYKVKVTAISVAGSQSAPISSGFFAIDNTVSAVDFASFNGDRIIALSDGRIVRLVQEDFNSKTKFNQPVQQTNWQRFESGDSESDLLNNHLVIKSPKGTTLIFRHD